MKFAKLILAGAISTALGFGAQSATAATVTSMTIEEIGAASGGVGTSAVSSNLGGIFYFATAGSIPNGDDTAASTFGGAPNIANGTTQSTITPGFEFGGVGAGFLFQPNSCGASPGTACTPSSPTGLAATYSSSTLSINLSDWGGYYTPFATQFPLGPDGVADPLVVSASALGAGGLAANQFYYTADWTHSITTAEGGFAFGGQIADWHLEGIGTIQTQTAVPVPAAVWLFGSGLVGLCGVARRKRQL
jgi:hypothetical protein